jgi:hypothetical protein
LKLWKDLLTQTPHGNEYFIDKAMVAEIEAVAIKVFANLHVDVPDEADLMNRHTMTCIQQSKGGHQI